MYRRVPRLTLTLVAGVLIGALGMWLWPGNALVAGGAVAFPQKLSIRQIRQDPSRRLDSEQLAHVIESLTQVLNDEINERRVLTEQFESLETDVHDLQSNLKVRVEEAFQAENDARVQASGNPAALSLDERFAAAGFSRQQLESIQRLQAEAQMHQIEMDDRARREGWFNTPRYIQESQELLNGAALIRDAIGDESYDRYLFASGAPNRIAVQSVIPASPAQNAGFRQGDVVVRYAGERVFSPQHLTELRSSGVRGEPVTVEVLRDGRVMQLTLARGPMGIATAPTVVDPTEPRE